MMTESRNTMKSHPTWRIANIFVTAISPISKLEVMMKKYFACLQRSQKHKVTAKTKPTIVLAKRPKREKNEEFQK